MKQVGVKQSYNQVPQTAWVSQFSSSRSWSQFSSSRSWSQLGTRSRIESQRQTEGWGPQWLTVEQPRQDEKEVLLWSEEIWVNMWQSVPVSNSPLTHNQHQPFRKPFVDKVWEVYFFFIKKCVRSFVRSLKSSVYLAMVPLIFIFVYVYLCGYTTWCPWCNGYRHRKWTRWPEFKSWTRLIAFHIALIPLGKVWIQLFSLQLWVNSRAD